MERIISITEQLVNDLRKARAKETPPEIHDNIIRVLIVEDDSNDAWLIKRTLTLIGCQPDVASTAEQALNMLYKSSHPTEPNYLIVFLDLKLPGMDGVHVLKKIRDHSPSLPVVIVTGAVYQSDLLEQAAQLGYFGLIKKPIEPEDAKEIFAKHRIPLSIEPSADK